MSGQQDPSFRQVVGVILRAPLVLFFAVCHICLFWWWFVLLAVIAAVVAVVFKPILFPFVYLGDWLALAFKNSDKPAAASYWDGYPERYEKMVEEALSIGFPTLGKWLIEGFDE